MLYTAGLIVSHLQLLFVAVVVLTNHNKPRWMTCDPTLRAYGEYITPLFLFKSANLSIICMVLYTLSEIHLLSSSIVDDEVASLIKTLFGLFLPDISR